MKRLLPAEWAGFAPHHCRVLNPLVFLLHPKEEIKAGDLSSQSN